MGDMLISSAAFKRLRSQVSHYSNVMNPTLKQLPIGEHPNKSQLHLLYEVMLELQISLARDMALIRMHLFPDGSAPRDEARGCHTLSAKECEVLVLFAKGYAYAEVAGLLGCKLATVQTYAKRIYRKLNVHSRAEAIFEACCLGLIRL